MKTALSVALSVALMAGCAGPPIGADRVSTRAAYNQVEKSALASGRMSSGTAALLHRYDLRALARQDPEEALRRLHRKALETDDRDLLLAAAELSYYAAERLREDAEGRFAHDARGRLRKLPGPKKAPSDSRDYYLGAAVYAYLFLFGQATGAKPDGFDRRYRLACDLYNYGLGLGLTEPGGVEPVVRLEDRRHALPFGHIDLRVDASRFIPAQADVARFLMTDQFSVRGLSVRNRQSGIGAPLIAVGYEDPALRIHRSSPATVFLRLPETLSAVSRDGATGTLELFSSFDHDAVAIDGASVPLETDFTAFRAHVLNQAFVWRAERLQFFSPMQGLKSQLILAQPYEAGRVPVVLVHGTYSSPVRWGELMNTLYADPVLRQRCQIWLYLYGSSKPILFSAAELRDALSSAVARLDPQGADASLRQMVVIGHSQGGLLTKLTATDTGDKIWRQFSDTPPEQLDVTDEQRATLRRLSFYTPLPFVKRVVFISTPHRGSYKSGGFVRNLARKLVKLPRSTLKVTNELLTDIKGFRLPMLSRGLTPNSLDGMSPENPVMLALADIPTAPGIQAHSIIAVKQDGDPAQGDDGVVKYQSAHLDYVASELVVRSGHSSQSAPATIEEVRRILREHLAGLPAADAPLATKDRPASP